MSRLIDWDNVCLVCLQKGANRYIFEEDNDSNMIADKIMKCSDILIKKDANQPRNICLKCLDDLHIAYKFRRNCEQSDSVIKALLNKNHQEFEIKDLWKALPTTLNSTLDISIKDEILDNFLVNDTYENTPILDLVNNPDSKGKFVEDDTDACVSNSSMERNNVKDGSNKTKQETNCGTLLQSGRRAKNLSKESCAMPSQIVENLVIDDTCKSALNTETKFADASDHSYSEKLNSMEASESNKTEQEVNCETSKPSRGRSKKSSQKICKICGHSFKVQNTLDIHMRRHNNERPFSCDDCDKAFVTRSELRSHMRVHTGQRPLKCQYCDRRFFDYTGRKNHERTHTGERPFVCPACGKSFAYPHVLTRHLRAHLGVKKFVCKECGKEFATKLLFEKHIARHLTRDKLDKSAERQPSKSLEKEFFQIEENANSNEINIKHEIIENAVIGDNCEEENTSCLDSENDSFNEAGFDKLIQGPNEEAFKRHRGRPKCLKICKICNRGFRHQRSLDDHIRRHNNERPFSCDHCDKSFVRFPELRRHMRGHTGQKPYKCHYCDRRFSDYGVRQNHESTHTGERPYKCPTCSKTFAYAKGLTLHLRIHNGEKKFMCKDCGREFRRKEFFEKHVAHHLIRDELDKSSEHKQKKRLEKGSPKKNADSNEINIKHEVESIEEEVN